jgi:hypothetical protein
MHWQVWSDQERWVVFFLLVAAAWHSTLVMPVNRQALDRAAWLCSGSRRFCID